MGLREDYARLEGPRVSTQTATGGGDNVFDAIANAAATALPYFMLKEQRKTRLAEQQALQQQTMELFRSLAGDLGGQQAQPQPSFMSPMSLDLTGGGGISKMPMTPDSIFNLIKNFSLAGR